MWANGAGVIRHAVAGYSGPTARETVDMNDELDPSYEAGVVEIVAERLGIQA